MSKNLLLKVSHTEGRYRNGRGDFWSDSYIKNLEVHLPSDCNIHTKVAEVLSELDGAEVINKGKPIGNIFIDTKEGNTTAVGYMYRTKHLISNRSENLLCDAYFNTWVTIKEIADTEIELI